jgi:histidine phosphotransfer protein HptB
MIDWARVNDLKEEIGLDDLAEVTAMFLDEADELVARLTPAASAAQIEADLHFLKGCAVNLGFRALAILCRTGERSARAADTRAFDLAEVAQVYQASKVAFLAGLKARKAA